MEEYKPNLTLNHTQEGNGHSQSNSSVLSSSNSPAFGNYLTEIWQNIWNSKFCSNFIPWNNTFHQISSSSASNIDIHTGITYYAY